jgi:hypothetical protein
MKNLIAISTMLVSIVLGGCHQDEEEGQYQTSLLIAKGSNVEVAIRSTSGMNTDGPIIFTGNDILWFDESSGELRFRDNMSLSDDMNLWKTVKFYINDEYLFTSMIFVSDLSSAVYNSLVLYYSIIENKFYLADGYPMDVSVLLDAKETQDLRDENMRQITNEWSRFIAQLKIEGKYRK